jgi:hypothetical protein
MCVFQMVLIRKLPCHSISIVPEVDFVKTHLSMSKHRAGLLLLQNIN